jgi:hypothetical protein
MVSGGGHGAKFIAVDHTPLNVGFARFGFQCEGRIRSMDDGCIPYQEYFFFLNL